MSSGYDEFVARVEQNTMHETIYTDSEGRPIVVIDMGDLFSYFELKKQWGWEMNETVECSYRAGNISVIKYAESPSTNPRADIENAIKFLQALLKMEQ